MKRGNNHSPYCGEYTLLVTRNTATNGNMSVHRGKSGERRVFAAQMPSATTMAAPADRRFTAPVPRQCS